MPDIYVSDGPESNIYGLEPNYGCCTANFPQGWPKYSSGLWMHSTADDGLVAVSYAPCKVATKLSDGTRVYIVVDTSYPFSEDVHISLITGGAFPLYLRIPTWVKPDGKSWVQILGRKISVTPGNFTLLNLATGQHEIHLHLDMPFRIEQGVNNAAVVYRGFVNFGSSANAWETSPVLAQGWR